MKLCVLCYEFSFCLALLLCESRPACIFQTLASSSHSSSFSIPPPPSVVSLCHLRLTSLPLLRRLIVLLLIQVIYDLSLQLTYSAPSLRLFPSRCWWRRLLLRPLVLARLFDVCSCVICSCCL